MTLEALAATSGVSATMLSEVERAVKNPTVKLAWQIARALDLIEKQNDSVLHSYRAALAFRRARAELRLGATTFHDLPEPLLAISRSHEGKVLTGVFNLSDTPQHLHLAANAAATGPQHATLDGRAITLPARGYLYLASSTAPKLAMGHETATA